jgi:3-keto-5-aminohexanoate cleavage enzyme
MDNVNSKFILNFTPTGMIPTKKMTPHVPIRPDEIIKEVMEVAQLGVNMVHLHARDPQTGEPTYQKEIYSQIIRGIRKKNKYLVLGVSTSGRNITDFEKRSECLELTGDAKPDMGSLTLSSLNFNKQASINTPEMIQMLAKKMMDNGIRPELEAFDLGMINYAKYLIQKGLVKPPYYFNLILGNIACAQANMLNLGLMVKDLPDGSIWSAGGIGDWQFQMNAMALTASGGVRVGLEDNIYYDRQRSVFATNRQLVERILIVSKALNRMPYSHKEIRTLLGLNN